MNILKLKYKLNNFERPEMNLFPIQISDFYAKVDKRFKGLENAVCTYDRSGAIYVIKPGNFSDPHKKIILEHFNAELESGLFVNNGFDLIETVEYEV